MAMAKRLFFFFAVNIAMMLTISVVLSLLGVGPYLNRQGLDYGNLAEFCFVWGMGGAFFSLALSKVIAKWTMGVEVIDPNATGELGDLVRTVHNLARAARLPRMPEVGVYDSPEVNAFATGPTKGSALVAVSSGLLRTMDRDQLEGVLAHEITHVANGDMVTLTLIQGIVNAFVMFISRVLAFAASQALQSKDSRESGRSSNGGVYFVVLIVSQIVFGLIGMMIVAYFSRWREFRADAGGARLAGRGKMVSALQRLRSYSEAVDTSHPSMQAFKINGDERGFFARARATHPPLEERIRRLEAGVTA